MATQTDIRITIRGPVPRIPFEEMAQEVLGAHYELSLVICGDRLARRINTEYRNKTYAPNVLSFELDAQEGEIFLNVRKAAREAQHFGVTVSKRVALLYVHGLFHLRGMAHSDAMEKAEQKVLKKYGLQ